MEEQDQVNAAAQRMESTSHDRRTTLLLKMWRDLRAYVTADQPNKKVMPLLPVQETSVGGACHWCCPAKKVQLALKDDRKQLGSLDCDVHCKKHIMSCCC